MTLKEKIIKLQTYKMEELNSSEKLNKSENPTCSDCVDRHAVDMLAYRYLKEPTDNHVAFYEDFLDLPSVVPIRPKGHWIKGYTFPDGEYWKCDKCNELIKVKYPMHYCNNCGSDNREVEE